jgi:thiol:disulfide interchange protein
MPILNLRKISTLALALMTTASFATLTSAPVWAKHHKAETSSDSGSLNWSTDLPQALQQAQASQKYVLLDVYTDWCRWCKKLDESTYPDPRVSELLNKSFVCVKVNAEKGSGRAIKAQYGVTGYPYIIVLNGDGSVRGKIPGYQGASAFARTLSQIVAGQASTN